MDGSPSTDKTMETVAERLSKLVDIAEVSRNIQDATYAAMTGTRYAPTGGASAAGTTAPATAERWLFRQRQSGRLLGRMAGKGFRGGAAVGRAVGRVAGSMFGKGAQAAGGAVGGAAGGAVGGAAGGIAALAVAGYEAHKALVGWTNAAFDSMRKLGEVNAQIAGIEAIRESREIVRNNRMGSEVADSAERLMEAEDRRKDATAPIEAAFTNLQNNVLATMNELAAPILEGIGEGVKLLQNLPLIGGWLKKKTEDDAKKYVPDPIGKELRDTIEYLGMGDPRERMMLDQLQRDAMNSMGGTAAPQGGAAAVGLNNRVVLPPL